jgi:hypothetical protein
MIMLRLLAVFIVPALLTGCVTVKDIDEIKAEIRDLKTEKEVRSDLKEYLYAKFSSEWQPCQPPGIEQNIECHYSLTITKIHDGMASGQIPEQVIQFHYDNCVKEIEQNQLPKDYPCPNPKGHHKDIVFKFELVDPATFQEGQTYHLVNVLGDKSLKLYKMSMKSK